MGEDGPRASGGTVVLASDTHLAPSDPVGIARFRRFLDGPCREAEQVLLLGDLFDFWVSPAQIDTPELRPALDGLADLVDAGVNVGFVEGNRDFAATPELDRLGVRGLPDVGTFEAGGLRVAYTHGDLLCTRDVRYQALRRIARSDTIRHLLRSVPPAWALSVGRTARAGSRLETSRKAYGDMGLEPGAVASLLARSGADALVCGHVHWGQRFTLDVEGLMRDVVVLSSWESRGSYVRVDAAGLAFHWFD